MLSHWVVVPWKRSSCLSNFCLCITRQSMFVRLFFSSQTNNNNIIIIINLKAPSSGQKRPNSHLGFFNFVFKSGWLFACDPTLLDMLIFGNKKQTSKNIIEHLFSYYKITKIVRALWLAERRVCMRVCKHACVM